MTGDDARFAACHKTSRRGARIGLDSQYICTLSYLFVRSISMRDLSIGSLDEALI